MADRVFRRAFAVLWAGRWGFVAQGLSLVVLVLPVVARLNEAVVFTVITASVVSILLPLGTWAIYVRLPQERRRTHVGSQLALACCTLATTVILVLTLSIVFWSHGVFPVTDYAFCVALQLFAQGLFVSSQAILTWRLAYQELMLQRLLYAGVAVLLTLAATLQRDTGPGFVAAISIAYVVAAVQGLFRSRHVLVFVRFATLTSVLHAGKSGAGLVVSLEIGAFAGQAAGLIVAGLQGASQQIWAVIVRVAGGMQTLGSNIFGPQLDVQIASEIRTCRRQPNLFPALRYAVGLTAIVFFGSLALSATVVVAFGSVRLLSVGELLAIVIAWVGQAGFEASRSVTARTLAMIGPTIHVFLWELSRACVLILVLTLLTGGARLITIGVLGVAGAVLYGWLLVLNAYRYRFGGRWRDNRTRSARLVGTDSDY